MITSLLSRYKKSLLWGCLILGVLALLLGGSILNLFHNKLEKRKLTRQSAKLDQEYTQLKSLKERLDKHDMDLLEEIARTEYHLAKPNEVEFRFDTK